MPPQQKAAECCVHHSQTAGFSLDFSYATQVMSLISSTHSTSMVQEWVERTSQPPTIILTILSDAELGWLLWIIQIGKWPQWTCVSVCCAVRLAVVIWASRLNNLMCSPADSVNPPWLIIAIHMCVLIGMQFFCSVFAQLMCSDVFLSVLLV